MKLYILKKKKRTFDIGCIVKWGSKIDKVTFEILKTKIFSTINVNALTSKKKNPSQPSIKKRHYFVYVCLC